jgi:cystathionine gamma-synthase
MTLDPSTLAVHAGRPRGEGEPLSPPVMLAANFHGERYARNEGTPTWEGLEQAVGALEGGTAVAFASGMGATAAILEELPPEARVVAPSDGYTGTRALLESRARTGKLTLIQVDMTDTDDVVVACDGADLVWVETPSNPLIGIAELDAIALAAKAANALLVVDSTLATPLLQRPLELGANVAMHSATKYIGGHSDLLMGVAATRNPVRAERLREARRLLGATPGALEAFLALRGLRTLPVRLERAQATALILARRLADHPQVERVRYPGLPDHPGHARAERLMDGFGAMLSFEVRGGAAAADGVCERVELITHATSLGGVETLIERRAKYPLEVAPESLLRLSVGCEDPEDLWTDLARALGER